VLALGQAGDRPIEGMTVHLTPSDGHNRTVIHGESRTARTTVHLTPSDGHNRTVI